MDFKLKKLQGIFLFFAHNTTEPLIIEDELLDERFKLNPLVLEEPKIGLYACFPLQTLNDQLIGILCIIDRKSYD